MVLTAGLVVNNMAGRCGTALGVYTTVPISTDGAQAWVLELRAPESDGKHALKPSALLSYLHCKMEIKAPGLPCFAVAVMLLAWSKAVKPPA